MEWTQDLMHWLCFCKESRPGDEDSETTVLTSNTTTVTRMGIPRHQSIDSHASYKVNGLRIHEGIDIQQTGSVASSW